MGFSLFRGDRPRYRLSLLPSPLGHKNVTSERPWFRRVRDRRLSRHSQCRSLATTLLGRRELTEICTKDARY